MANSTFKSSVSKYEAWLRQALDGEIVKVDLSEKHEKMADDSFAFLRATYWRWAETAEQFWHHLDDTPKVLAIGDIHLENFGTWRDDDGRLVWGVNDFDEAAEMPYVFDLIRLATSAVLAAKKNKVSARNFCEAILTGYSEGLACPRPFVLDEDTAWLRRVVEVPAHARQKFWNKMHPNTEDKDKRDTRRFKRELLQ